MPKVTVRPPTGEPIEVDAPEGASRQDIIKLAKEQRQRERIGMGDVPVVPPGTPGVLKPSVSGYLAEGLKKRGGDIGAMIGATAVPGAGFLPFAGRLLASEAGQAAGSVAMRQPYTPGVGAGSQVAGEAIGKVVSPLLSPATYKAFATRTARAISDWLKDAVPAWKGYSSSGKGLYDMAHGTGQRILSKTFEREIQGIKKTIPETLVLQIPGTFEVSGQLMPTTTPRNARALIDELPDLRKAGGAAYHQALRALADQLPKGLSPELDAARRQYRFGAGWIEFAEKGKFLHGEKYAPETAQSALDRFGKRLLGRGMDELSQIIRGPAAKPIEARPHGILERRVTGLLGGELIGYPTGHPYLGPAAGLAAMELIPATTYRNVPTTPAQQFARRLGRAGIAEGLREGARGLGLTEQLPQVGP